MPLEATQDTAEGAKAFAEFFIKTIDWGYATTSGVYIRHYAQPTCQTCTAFAATIDKARTAEHHFVGGRFTTFRTALANTPLADNAEQTVLVSFSTISLEEINNQGRFVRGYPAHHGERFEVSIGWRTDRWSVVKLAIEV